MKALYNIIVGVIGGILGIAVLALLWACNTLITLAGDLWKFCKFSNSENSDSD